MVNLDLLEKEQAELARKIVISDCVPKEITTIAGCDQSYDGHSVISAIVVLDYKTLEIREKVFAVVNARIPYIPDFLSYREAPAAVEAFTRLKTRPDLLLCDGDGILHLRKLGIASHLGILLDIPTIGVSKNLLLGNIREGKIFVEDDVRGVELKTREYSNPIYISPGHQITLSRSVAVVQHCMRPPHKMPEPLHQAHKYAQKIRKSLC